MLSDLELSSTPLATPVSTRSFGLCREACPCEANPGTASARYAEAAHTVNKVGLIGFPPTIAPVCAGLGSANWYLREGTAPILKSSGALPGCERAPILESGKSARK